MDSGMGPSCGLRLRLVAWLWLCLCPALANALVVYGDDQLAGQDPATVGEYSQFGHWDRLVRRGSGAGVLLGRGWVMTMGHVGAGSVQTQAGNVYERDPNQPGIRLENPDESLSDLMLFRLLDPPQLSVLPITSEQAELNDELLMLGAGPARSEPLITWDVDPRGDPWLWTAPASDPLLPDVSGYITNPQQRAWRWGEGKVATVDQTVSVFGYGTQMYSSKFESEPRSTQAVQGDSGGPVFRKVNGQWRLSGGIGAVSLLPDQPGGNQSAMVNSSFTAIVDLAVYYEQMMDLIYQAVPGDFNGDGFVTLSDIEPFKRALVDSEQWQADYPELDLAGTDPNGDGQVTLSDIPPFKELLADTSAYATGQGVSDFDDPESSSLTPDTGIWAAVPEPATGIMIGLGLLGCLRRRAPNR